MKYIRSFKESLKSFTEEELEVFCKGRLAYILDDRDFELKVTEIAYLGTEIGRRKDNWFYKIQLKNNKLTKDRIYHQGFNFKDIRDEYVTFIQSLDDTFGIYGYNSEAYSEKDKFLSIKNIEVMYFPLHKGRPTGSIHYKIIPIEELDTLERDRIIYINVYVKSFDIDED